MLLIHFGFICVRAPRSDELNSFSHDLDKFLAVWPAGHSLPIPSLTVGCIRLKQFQLLCPIKLVLLHGVSNETCSQCEQLVV